LNLRIAILDHCLEDHEPAAKHNVLGYNARGCFGGLVRLYGLAVVAANDKFRKPLVDLLFEKTIVVTGGAAAPEVPASVDKEAAFHAYHPTSSLSGVFGGTQQLETIHQWTMVGVSRSWQCTTDSSRTSRYARS
jgi:hypothetical protein